jgi:hypothetical protein
VFYLRYHLYATYFPLWALAVYEREAGRRPASLGGEERKAPEAAADRKRGTEANR